jgi:hypothetical protein
MPLTFVEHPEFSHEVAVMVPVDGGHREERFRARFRVTDRDDHDLTTEAGTTAFLRAAVIGAEDLVAADGAPLPWSDAVRDWLVTTPFTRVALLAAYFSATAKVRAKN